MPLETVTIGTATLHLGDCREVIPSLSGVTALIADPPYSSGGLFRGDRMTSPGTKYKAKSIRKRYPEFSGDNRDQRSFMTWASLWLDAVRRVSAPGALFAVFSDWRQLPTMTDAVQAGGWIWRGIAVWDKGRGCRPTLGRLRAQGEFIVWGTNGPRKLCGPVVDGVLSHPMPGAQKVHLTEKPAALLAKIMPIAGELVLDPFMGSGSTGVAAVAAGRHFVGCEINHEYFDIACRRIEAAQAAAKQAAD